MTRWLLLLLAAGSLRADTLHEETFSDGTPDLTWMSTWGEAADQVVVDYVAGNPSGDGFIGTLGNAESGGGVGTAVVDDPSLTDYEISAQVYLVPNTTHYRGIVGRVTAFPTDSTTYYGFYAFVADLSEGTGMGDQRLMLRKWNPGGGSMTNIKVWSIGELGALYPATEGWYELAMDFSGSQITCSINGNVLPNGTWTDGEFSGGGFGVYYFDFSDMAGHLRFDDVVVEGEDSAVAPPQLPQGLSLGNPWPNPFNPVVHVDLQLDAAALVTARVYDLGGRVVRTLSVGPLAAGRHTLSWDGRADDGRPAASGSYLLSVDDGRAARRTRLTLLR